MSSTVAAGDFIDARTWERLADPERGVRYCCAENVAEFFREHADDPEYVLLSGYSDYGLELQAENFPNADLPKRLDMVPWDRLMGVRNQYVKVELGPLCHVENCHPDHRYSMKSYADTFCTFPEVPANCTSWFCTNVNVDHPKVSCLPFGICDQGDGRQNLVDFQGVDKSRLLYVNFQEFTRERAHLNDHYRKAAWATHRAGVPHREYAAEMAQHKFVLCPAGNGLDCYRVWEALYLGCVPILKDSVFARHLLNLRLPLVISDNLFGLTPDGLNQIYDQLRDALGVSLAAATESHWRSVIFSGRFSSRP